MSTFSLSCQPSSSAPETLQFYSREADRQQAQIFSQQPQRPSLIREVGSTLGQLIIHLVKAILGGLSLLLSQKKDWDYAKVQCYSLVRDLQEMGGLLYSIINLRNATIYIQRARNQKSYYEQFLKNRTQPTPPSHPTSFSNLGSFKDRYRLDSFNFDDSLSRSSSSMAFPSSSSSFGADAPKKEDTQALQLIQEGKLEEALRKVEGNIFGNETTKNQLFQMIVRAYLDRGDIVNALKIAEKISIFSPIKGDLLLEVANVSTSRGDQINALKAVKMLPLCSKSAQKHSLLRTITRNCLNAGLPELAKEAIKAFDLEAQSNQLDLKVELAKYYWDKEMTSELSETLQDIVVDILSAYSREKNQGQLFINAMTKQSFRAYVAGAAIQCLTPVAERFERGSTFGVVDAMRRMVVTKDTLQHLQILANQQR